jgi:gliding-associated putative ABC transporter substrate-binding component GldG
MKKQQIKNTVVLIIGVITTNVLGSFFYTRFDLTKDKRYTLSQTSIDILKNTKEPLYIDVFLEGNLPGEFKRLQNETKQILDEYQSHNSNVIYQFINPLENPDEASENIKKFEQRGLTSVNIAANENGKKIQQIVYPWAIATYKDKSTKLSLLKNKLGVSAGENINNSVQHLEYAFSNAFYKISTEKKKKIAVLKGNGEIEDIFKADFLKEIRENYFIAPFTLDSVAKSPNKTLADLKTYDLAILTKPKEAFTDQEKMVLDQYIINGGKTLMLVETVNIDMENLSKTGKSIAFAIDLGLNDLFFKYGFRINPLLIKDMQCAPIALATGNKGNQTQYTKFPWLFAPYIVPDSHHPVVNNIDGLKFDFVNPIDTIKNNIKKTILLHSSPYSKKVGTPLDIDLKIVNQQPNQDEYSDGNLPISILLEGKFKSVFQNRVLPFEDSTFKTEGKTTKMIVVSDGDIIKNQLDDKGNPLELGFDKWTNSMYSNKEFMMNCVNYLLDDTGLINIRSKEVNLPLLDKEKVSENYTATQLQTVLLPLVMIMLFGLATTYFRKRAYSK